MAQSMRPQPTIHGSLFATDGKPHRLPNTLLAITLVLGALSLATAAFHGLHLLTSWAGLVGLLTGAYGQYVSETTRERFGLIIGMGASALGLLLGMSHGGLFGGVVG